MQEFANDIQSKLNEETTSASIAYLPGGFTSIASMFKKMAKIKPKWKVDVIDNPSDYNMHVEKELTITVPKLHAMKFQEESGINDFGTKEIDLSGYVAEAMTQEAKMGALLNSTSDGIYEMLVEPPLLYIDQDSEEWLGIFGGEHIRVKNNAINLGNVEEDIENLISVLDVQFAEDRGGVEMLLQSIKTKKPLARFDVFNSFEYLLSSAIRSVYKGTKLAFEGTVDMNFGMSEKIYVTNPEVLQAVEEEFNIVKVNRNVVYPVGNRFQPNFFVALKRIIDEQ